MVATIESLCLALILLTTTVTPYFLGSAGAYLQIVGALVATALLLIGRTELAIRGEPTHLLLLAALVVLVFCFAGTAGSGHDLLYGFNFIGLALFAPLSRFLARFAAPGNARRVAGLALAGSAAAAASALFRHFVLGQNQVWGGGSDPIWSAQAALILGFVATVGLAERRRENFIYLLGPVLGLVACLLTQERGPALAAPVLLLVLILIGLRGGSKWLVLVGAAGTMLLVVGLTKLLMPAAFLRYRSLVDIGHALLRDQSLGEVSARLRLDFYISGIRAFLDSPWIGYGWAGKMQAIVPYLPGDGMAVVAPHNHLHSDPLDFAVSGGVLGLLAYAAILVAPIAGAVLSPRDGQYRSRLLGVGLLAAGYLVCGLTYLMFGFEFMTELYVCLAAVILGYCRDAPPAVAGSDARRHARA